MWKAYREKNRSVFENVTIICFNYDRCIEQFLTYWLISVYGISYGDAQELVAGLKILRPYGAVAPLPIGGGAGVDFGANLRFLDLRPLIQNIKTFTEQIGDENVMSEIRSAVAGAETIVFLGFAYLSKILI